MFGPFRSWMLVLVEGLFRVAGYMRIERTIFIVPYEFDADKQVAFLVNCYVVVLFQGRDEMVGVYVAVVLDAKVINYQSECDWAPYVSP